MTTDMSDNGPVRSGSSWLGRSGSILLPLLSCSNLTPDWLVALNDAVSQGNQDRALNIQHRITQLARVFDQGNRLAALKVALEAVGHAVGPPALKEQHQIARATLGEFRSPQQLESSYLFGTVDDIVADCAQRVAAGVSHLILHPYTDDPHQLRSWGRDLLPQLLGIEVGERVS